MISSKIVAEFVDESPMVKHLLQSEHPNADSFMAEFLTMALLLGLTLAGMCILAWFLKKFLNSRMHYSNQTSAIRIVERRALGPRSMIYLIEIEKRQIVVGETPAGLTHLGEITPSPERRPPEHSLKENF